MIDKLDIASKNWADDYMTQFGRRFNNMLRDAFIAGFKKGVELSKEIVRCKDCIHQKDGVKDSDGNLYCLWHIRMVDENDFCSSGVRKG